MKLCWSNNTNIEAPLKEVFSRSIIFLSREIKITFCCSSTSIISIQDWKSLITSFPFPIRLWPSVQWGVPAVGEEGSRWHDKEDQDQHCVDLSHSSVLVSAVKLDYQLEILSSQYSWPCPARPVPTLKLIGNFLKLIFGADHVWEGIMSVWTSTKN